MARPGTAVGVLGALLLLLASAGPVRSQVFAEGWLGSAYSVPLPLSIVQDGEETIRMTADYGTRPFEGSPYYAWRVGFWTGDTGWALDLVHHKLYLDNPPPEVDRFEVSHGFNLLAVTHGWRSRRTRYRVGAGIVVAHPEIEVRGRVTEEDDLPGGYSVAGPSLQAAAGRTVSLSRRLALTLEGRLSLSYARLPVASGHADVANIGLHVHAGLLVGEHR